MDKKEDFSNIINNLDDGQAKSAESGGPRGADEPEGLPPEGGSEIPEALEHKLVAKTKEAEEYKDKHLRLAAEFENYKRLALRDQREHVRFANERIIKDLLPVIDNLERAIQSGQANASGDALLQGVELTLKQALEVLEKFGVRQISTVGEPFDPTSQQAVTQIESDQLPENHVVEEFQRGYLLNDRVLRAAMVAVAVPPASQQVEGAATGEGGQENDA